MRCSSAGLAVTSELSLDALLHRLIEVAAELTGARYAAIGVIDANGPELEQFITHGIDADLHAEIGALPRGRGILGVLIRDARPLRLHDLAEDPRSVGFPPGHPPMRSFLGVPILLRGVAYGNLYLTEKQGGEDFTDEDEELVTLLAGQAAVAIENARLYEASTRWSRQLQSLNEVGNALATETDLERLLDLIVRRLRELLGARVVALVLPSGSDELRFAAVAGAGAEDLLGTTISRSGSKSGAVLERRRSERIDSVLDDPEVHQEVSRQLAARTGMWVPLIARDQAIGVLEIHDKEGPDPRFSHDDFRLAETFAARAAVAVELSQRVARDAVRRVVQAQELERQRLARELHDETGQALTSILLGLKPLEEALADHPARAALAELREHVVSALQDVRRLAVELRPAVLDDFGLVPGARTVDRCVRGTVGRPRRLPLGARRQATAERGRDNALSRCAGVAHEHRQTRERAQHQRLDRPAGDYSRSGDRGRRSRLRPERRTRGRSRAPGHARAALLRRRAAGDRVPPGRRDDDRRRGTARVSIRVLIVDDHAVVRSGLRLLLDAEDDIEPVGEAGNARDAVFQARALKPDVILLDVVMPDQTGLEALPQLRHENPDAKVLILSMQDEPRYVREAFAAGASGYVLKEAADNEVVAAIRDVAAGGRYVNPELGARLVAADAEAARRADEDPLSEREREVLRLLALGHTNQEIAKMLYISVRTAETHRAHIMQKLRLQTRADLVAYALERGLLEPE